MIALYEVVTPSKEILHSQASSLIAELILEPHCDVLEQLINFHRNITT